MPTTFTNRELVLGVGACEEARNRLKKNFDGKITITEEELQRYCDLYPSWGMGDLVWLTWALFLNDGRWAIPDDFLFTCVRIALRDVVCKEYDPYRETLGDDNYIEASEDMPPGGEIDISLEFLVDAYRADEEIDEEDDPRASQANDAVSTAWEINEDKAVRQEIVAYCIATLVAADPKKE